MLSKKVLPMAVAVAVAAATATAALAANGGSNTLLGQNTVGRTAHGALTSTGQFVTPVGRVIEQPGRTQATAVSPDGKTSVSLSWENFAGFFTATDLVNGKVLQTVTPTVGSKDVSFNGLLYTKDATGKANFLWAAQSADLLKFPVNADGTLGAPEVVKLPGVTRNTPAGSHDDVALPASIALAPDGQKLLITLNGNNTLAVLDPAAPAQLTQIPVGNAPRDVVVVGQTAYVANQGGRTATSQDFTNPSYDTDIVSESRDGRAISGTVSAVDLTTGKVTATIPTGLQPTSMLVWGTDVLVTNSNDDTVSVIDTTTNTVVQTIATNPAPGAPYGAQPNGLARLDATHLAVTLGRDNAVAVYTFTGGRNAAELSGLVPTGWYPSDVIVDAPLNKVIISSIKGLGSVGPTSTQNEGAGTKPALGHTVYAHVGTEQVLDRSALTSPKALQAGTYQVMANNQWFGLAARNAKGSRKAKPVAVPVHLGDPSLIKHVFLIVKENRTYDQVLGDDKRGNGDPSLAQFGQKVTPNFHALAKTGPLIDNLYSGGTLSADGHNWLTQAFNNDYNERQFGNFTRSYPASGADSLAYGKPGFLWDDAQRHGVTAHSWGEYANFFSGPNNAPARGDWKQWYHDSQVLEGKAKGPLHAPVGYYQTHSDVPSLEKILSPAYPNFQLQIPDQYRTDVFLKDFKDMEAHHALPALNMAWVMCDHTSGSAPGFPVPASQVADNDLAVGRMVDAISHSKDWKSTAVFVIEDDSQDGVDHVDGHRNVALIASPYAKRGTVDHTYYSQLNLVRTIEQILGLPAMNQLDLAATPMFNAFTNKATAAPYAVKENTTPLDTLTPALPAAATPNALVQGGSMSPAQLSVIWRQWASQQNFRSEDIINMAQLNRSIWYSSYHYTRPYPGDTAVLPPALVPGTGSTRNDG